MTKIVTDVAVLGAGPSGLAATLRAAELGLKVCLFEKTDNWGGVYNGGMGPFGAGTHIQKKYGMVNGTVENAFNILFDFTHGNIDARLASAFIGKTAFTVKWLEDHGVVYADPTTSPFGGEGDTEYFCHIIADHPYYKKWMYIPDLLMDKIKGYPDAAVYLETYGTRLLKTGGKVTGLFVKDKDGVETEVETKAVIIATGGFMGSPELIKEYTTFENDVNIFFSRQRPNICGDGMKMAWEIGAGRSEMMVDIYKGMPIHCGPSGTKEGWELLAVPNLLVNYRGERFMNESYPDRYYMANAIHRQPKGCAFMITSSSITDRYKNGELKMGGPPGSTTETDIDNILKEAEGLDYNYIFAADSIEELAEKTGINCDTLKKTLAEYNGMCEKREDNIFFKNSDDLKPLTGPKYYAAQFFVDSFGALGGLRINYKTEVVTDGLDPIPGLYGAGSEVNTLYAGTYPGRLSGNTSGFAYNSGVMAAESSAEYIKSGD